MNISGSRAAQPVSLLPFGYLALTRLNSPRDYAYLIASTWLPCIWLAFRLAELSLPQTAVAFIAGYIAFVSAYEVGYLANDGWDARRAADGRQRIPFPLSTAYVAAFLIIRIAAWTLIGIWMGWVESLIWLGGFATLALALGQHNLVESTGLRLASFYELATLRFLLPVIAVIPAAALQVAILTALLLYAYPRLLSYMDGKGVLILDERRRPAFAFMQIATLTPLILFLAYILEATVLAELLGYFLAVYALWWIAYRARVPQATQ